MATEHRSIGISHCGFPNEPAGTSSRAILLTTRANELRLHLRTERSSPIASTNACIYDFDKRACLLRRVPCLIMSTSVRPAARNSPPF